MLFIPDEIIYLLRKILEIELPFKYLRRILKHLKDSEINLIAKKHNINRKLSRIEKIRIVSQWDVAFQNFRVCLANVPDRLNCGKCEKCVRTMTELTALGLLSKTTAFVEDEITPEHISQFDITIRVRPPFYRPLIPLLREQGRDDLAGAIEKQLQDYLS